MTLVRLEPAAPLSGVKHSTTVLPHCNYDELLCCGEIGVDPDQLASKADQESHCLQEFISGSILFSEFIYAYCLSTLRPKLFCCALICSFGKVKHSLER